jgi:hypothetical protein
LYEIWGWQDSWKWADFRTLFKSVSVFCLGNKVIPALARRLAEFLLQLDEAPA